jgi:hypothetical protein
MAGCRPNVIEGAVVDVKGDALPCVAVTVTHERAQGFRARDGAQSLTNALGRYRVPFQPGSVELEFIKTGYTPGRLLLTVPASREVPATTVILWQLPAGKGVYLFENFRYEALSAVEPRPYRAGQHEVVHGAPRNPELGTENANPMILCYKMPDYDIALCKLQLAEVALPGMENVTFTEKVWIRAEPLPVTLERIDEPEGSLFELRLSRPLEPGVYGIHWGALDGYTTTDPRVFLFRVAEPGEGAPEESAPMSLVTAGPQETPPEKRRTDGRAQGFRAVVAAPESVSEY